MWGGEKRKSGLGARDTALRLTEMKGYTSAKMRD